MSTQAPILDPPPTAEPQEFRQPHPGHPSVGPLIAALAVITILGAIAVMIGRICSGRRIMGHPKYYDIEGWFENKCSSCIDGRIDFPSKKEAVPEVEKSGGDAAPSENPVEAPAELYGEMEQGDPSKRPES